MNNNTNGILDTRLSQNLVKEFNIPANIEYGEHSPFKIGGGNAIWITHIPPNVKVWFSTNQNKDDAQRLDYMNRGMRYLEIGNEGITRIYDNFYIFTEGTDDNDFIKVCVSTEGANVEPILSSNTNQIDQVDMVGKIETIDTIKKIEDNGFDFGSLESLIRFGRQYKIIENINLYTGYYIGNSNTPELSYMSYKTFNNGSNLSYGISCDYNGFYTDDLQKVTEKYKNTNYFLIVKLKITAQYDGSNNNAWQHFTFYSDNVHIKSPKLSPNLRNVCIDMILEQKLSNSAYTFFDAPKQSVNDILADMYIVSSFDAAVIDKQ